MNALKDLLTKIKAFDTNYIHLPDDPRTLLHITSEKVCVLEISGGDYWHFGLHKIIKILVLLIF